jgi:hypothetical protein
MLLLVVNGFDLRQDVAALSFAFTGYSLDVFWVDT